MHDVGHATARQKCSRSPGRCVLLLFVLLLLLLLLLLCCFLLLCVCYLLLLFCIVVVVLLLLLLFWLFLLLCALCVVLLLLCVLCMMLLASLPSCRIFHGKRCFQWLFLRIGVDDISIPIIDESHPRGRWADRPIVHSSRDPTSSRRRTGSGLADRRVRSQIWRRTPCPVPRDRESTPEPRHRPRSCVPIGCQIGCPLPKLQCADRTDEVRLTASRIRCDDMPTPVGTDSGLLTRPRRQQSAGLDLAAPGVLRADHVAALVMHDRSARWCWPAHRQARR